ncbi:hypothetical protein ACD661_01785 [Legionella lytica]|uniref:Transmembrane protein n=1 Tax=Legionella lytica TaxID=96232 RepID=A0ABW8D3L8_9GAMM
MDEILNPTPLTTEPVWKQSMLILLVLFPAVMLENMYFFPHLASLNPVLARFLGVIIIVCSISWVLMPMVHYSLGWWLSPISANQEYGGFFIVLCLYLMEICFFLLLYQY